MSMGFDSCSRLFLSHLPSSSLSFFFYFSLLVVSLLSTVPTVDSTVLPSNSSAGHTQHFHLEGTQVDLPRDLRIAPLTRSLSSLDSSQLRGFNHSGTLVQVDPSNSLLVTDSDIAFVSCDSTAYTGNLDADATLHNVYSRRPSAVLLYSTVASHCNYTEDQSEYTDIFTLLDASIARHIEAQLSGNQTGSVQIVPDMSTLGVPSPSDGGGGDDAADSPNTAMIILYSITGIITALFLSIIITGAIRAHRHPERYGPRQRPGRPRQSRARGIARAMLETIPIVKFGDENNNEGKLDADKGDVEMAVESEAPASQLREDVRQPTAIDGTTSPKSETPPNPATAAAESKERPTETTDADATDHPNFSCPICTDDFVKGQDLRVLPCNHQFHPECIDPWLVNVSGTCPLCRIDLNPPKPEDETENQEAESAEGQGDTSATNNTTQQTIEETPTHRNRLSSYLHGTLNARRMRDASVEERLAALRSVREEANRDAENGNEHDERRRNRLTARLRERFRIRTRAHGAHDEAAASS
ncbi:hypothetical protein BDV18DRAFT_137218 [Aspergillus unguis]